MSSSSVTSNKRENEVHELKQELEAVRAMNASLRAYMDHLRMFKRNLSKMNDSCTQLSRVNSQWIDTISTMR